MTQATLPFSGAASRPDLPGTGPPPGPPSVPARTVDVLVDDRPRLGPLSYRVPEGLEVDAGDAVHVPFGKGTGYGLVVGPGDPEKATRELIARFGRRAHPLDVAAALSLAARHFADTATALRRLSPHQGRNASPLDAGPVVLADPGRPPVPVQRRHGPVAGRYLLHGPLTDQARLAAETAHRFASGGQVLVLCPTRAVVAAVCSQFCSGAARLDASAVEGAWNGFVSGTVTVGVGTRSAAWYSPACLAAIVVVDEAHPGHLGRAHPKTHSRDVAAERAFRHGIPLYLLSSTPTAAGLGSRVKLAVAGSSSDWPKVHVVRADDWPPEKRLLPPPAFAALERAGRRGLCVAPPARRRLVCAGCRSEVVCPDGCTVVCDHVQEPCARCGSAVRKVAGWDASRIVEASGLVSRPVEFADLPKFSAAGTVVLCRAESLLDRAGLAPLARSASLLSQAARAAGRHGTLWVCTEDPSHPVLAPFAAGDLAGVARAVYDEAREAALPPFGRLVELEVASAHAPDLAGWPGTVFGPSLRREGEWEALVVVAPASLPAVGRHLERLRRRHKVRVTVS